MAFDKLRELKAVENNRANRQARSIRDKLIEISLLFSGPANNGSGEKDLSRKIRDSVAAAKGMFCGECPNHAGECHAMPIVPWRVDDGVAINWIAAWSCHSN